MIVLAFDSSADAVAVAVLRDGVPLAERSHLVARPRSERLLGAAQAVLEEAEVALATLSLIAVATGPGSFNGIRGGIAVAQGLALGLGLPTVGVPTLEARAFSQAERSTTVCAVLPAGRGEVYAATYVGDWHDWQRQGDYTVGDPIALLATLAPGTLLCGAVPPALEAAASARGLAVAPPAFTVARAAFVGALAALRYRSAGFDAATSLHPLYLRRPGITQPTRPLGLGAR